MSPRPPKEKRGGIPISPRTPLKRHKGAELRFLPFGNPTLGGRVNNRKENASCQVQPSL
nr:MAG TPA: hypothetical protein [Caudoviricetes sp.]